MNAIIAFCGLNCSACEAYLVTQADDTAGKERLVAKWRVEFNAPNMSIADVTCDGCTSATGRLGGYCGICPIRACSLERKVANCAYCAEYDACDKLAGFFKGAPAAQATLDEIRRML